MLPHPAEKLTQDGVSSVAPGVPLPTHRIFISPVVHAFSGF